MAQQSLRSTNSVHERDYREAYTSGLHLIGLLKYIPFLLAIAMTYYTYKFTWYVSRFLVAASTPGRSGRVCMPQI